ncbi:MAG: response regulator [Granulosicoccaceae bacterium]|jgi:FixJ family two-component response regulator
MQPEYVVYIVDDDNAIRESLALLLRSEGLRAQSFPSAIDFLDTYDGSPGCLVVDIRMPNMTGLELQEVLNEKNIRLPLIVMTGHGDVSVAVQAMRAGAVDFIEKPFNTSDLLQRVNEILEQLSTSQDREAHDAKAATLLESLTSREQEVLQLLVAGKINKLIAAELGISTRTVEAHRANIMQKMQAKSLSDLIRMALSA